MSDWIRSRFRRAIDQTANGHGDWCVNLQSRTNSDHWIQITWDNVNLAYPSADVPNELVASLPKVQELQLACWEPNLYLTLSHGADESLPVIADFVAAYIERTLGESAAESQWEVTEEAL